MTSLADLHRVLDKDVWYLEEIKTFLERDSSSVNKKDRHKETPLIRVLQNENSTAKLVRLLLQFGADANCFSNYATHCLNVALWFPGRDDIIKALLENGAKVNNSSLCVALHCGASKSVLELLLDAGCSTSVLCKHGPVLYCAVDNPKSGLETDVFQLLIDRGADVRAIYTVWMGKKTILCSALQKGHKASTIRLLMDAGASLNECLRHSSPFFCAAAFFMSHTYPFRAPLTAELVNIFIQSGTSLEATSSKGTTPLQVVLQSCEYEIEAIKVILSCLPDIDPNKQSYLHIAMRNFHYCNPAVVELLIKHGVGVNELNVKGETALHVALRHGKNKSVIKALLESGAQINQENKYGETPLDIALQYPIMDFEIVEELYAAGAFTRHSYLLAYLIPKLLGYGLSFARMKVLLRYFFLQYSLDDCGGMFQNGQYSEALSNFRDVCNRELQKMKSKQIGEDFTLHEFVSGHSSIGRTLPEKKYELERLLKIFVDDTYPVYFSVISAKVGKDLQAQASMEKMLEEIQVYTITYSFENPGVEKKIFLPYDIVFNIARFCTGDNLFRLILSFFNPHGRPFSDQSSNEKKKNCKRKAECDLQCPKGPKSH